MDSGAQYYGILQTAPLAASAGRKSAYIHRIYALATMNEDEDSPLPLNR